MDFFVFRCSTDRELFLAVDRSPIPAGALKLCSGTWEPFKNFRGTGEPRVAFPSESEMEGGIKEKGYFTFRAGVYVTEVSSRPVPPLRRKR